MIVAEWEGASIIADGESVTSPDPTVQRILDGLLKGDVMTPASIDDEQGTITETFIRLKPGQPGHARAVLHTLKGIVFIVDDGADIPDPDA
jgi:hypothetical protein